MAGEIRIYDFTDTWDNAGTTWNSIKVDVTITGAAAGSRLLNLSAGGVSRFTVDKNGGMLAAYDGSNYYTAVVSSAGLVTFDAVGASAGFAFSDPVSCPSIAASGNITLAGDLIITREAAATLQLGVDATGPINQTIKSCDRLSPDGAGSDLYINGGRGLGNFIGGSIFFQTTNAAAPGVAGAFAMRLTVSGSGIAVVGTVTASGSVAGVSLKSEGGFIYVYDATADPGYGVIFHDNSTWYFKDYTAAKAQIDARNLTLTRTTEQLRVGFDGSNYYTTTVSSTGVVTFDAVGSGHAFAFSDPVSVPALTSTGQIKATLATMQQVLEYSSGNGFSTTVASDGSTNFNLFTISGTPTFTFSKPVSFSTAIAVADGGTGRATLTSGSLLKGNGTGQVAYAAAGTDYLAPAALATSAEVTTGSSTAKIVTPDSLRGSDYGKRHYNLFVSPDNSTTVLAVANGIGPYFRVPTLLNGWKLVEVAAGCNTPSSSGVPTFQIRRRRLTSATATADTNLLTTTLTIDATEYDSKDATAAVIDTASSNDVVNTGDRLYVDCTTAGTGCTGVEIAFTFQKP